MYGFPFGFERDLKGKVIVITGASSGIGAATALACADAGMDVVLAARRRSRLEQVGHQVRRRGCRALEIVCDVDQDQDVAGLIQQTMQAWGRLDVMFANAGYGLFASVLGTSDAQMRAIFETNYFGTLRCVRQAVSAMRQSAGEAQEARFSGVKKPIIGHVLICSSAVSEIGMPMHGAYCATKAAQDAVASALRAELAGERILVTSVHPIGTRSEFYDRVQRRADKDLTPVQATKDRHLQSAEQVAMAILRCLRRPRPEVWPHLGVRLGVAACTAWPALGCAAMKQLLVRMTHHK